MKGPGQRSPAPTQTFAKEAAPLSRHRHRTGRLCNGLPRVILCTQTRCGSLSSESPATTTSKKPRGILRLLGMTTHHLRESDQGENLLLIHPHHIDPENGEIHAQLTTRIDRGEFASAIVADITGAESTANRIDETRPTRPARRLARAALLASLAPISSARGITPGDLTRAVITPFDEDPSVVANAITSFGTMHCTLTTTPV